MSRASSVDYPNRPLSRRVGVHTPSWVTYQEEHAGNTVRFPETREASLAEQDRNWISKLLCFPFKPLGGRKDKFEMETCASNEGNIMDPTEVLKTKIHVLETELDRLNKRLEVLRRDYSRLYSRAQHADSRCVDARTSYKRACEAYDDLSRATYEALGEEQFRALKAQIRKEKQEQAAKRIFMTSQTMLAAATTDDSEVDSVLH